MIIFCSEVEITVEFVSSDVSKMSSIYRVFSAYIKEVDEKPSPSAWGDKTTFASLIAEYSRPGKKLITLMTASFRRIVHVYIVYDAAVTYLSNFLQVVGCTVSVFLRMVISWLGCRMTVPSLWSTRGATSSIL